MSGIFSLDITKSSNKLNIHINIVKQYHFFFNEKDLIPVSVVSMFSLEYIMHDRDFSSHLSMKGVESLEEIGPNISDSNNILRITLLTMSPRYIPDIIFSKPCIPNPQHFSQDKRQIQQQKSIEAETNLIIWIRALSI